LRRSKWRSSMTALCHAAAGAATGASDDGDTPKGGVVPTRLPSGARASPRRRREGISRFFEKQPHAK
jgi:hypothetical protein